MSTECRRRQETLTFMGKECFSTLSEFWQTLRRYQLQTGTSFATRDVHYKPKIGKWLGVFAECYRLKVTCVHSSKKKRKPRMRPRFADLGCNAHISLVCDIKTRKLKVTSVDLNHCHETFTDCPGVYHSNRQLTQSQKNAVFRMLIDNSSVKQIREDISRDFGVILPGYDVHNMRKKMMLPSQQFDVILAIMEHNESFKVAKCADRIALFSFALPGSIELFMRFGEVLMMDSTTQCGSYHLWHVYITDNHGRSRAIFHAFLESETESVYEIAASLFLQTFSEVNHVESIIIGNQASQIQAVRQTFPRAKVYMCCFHVLASLKNKLNSIAGISQDGKKRLINLSRGLVFAPTRRHFDLLVNKIDSCQGEYAEYLRQMWLPDSDQWALYARTDAVSFGNGTDKPVDSAKRYLMVNIPLKSSLVEWVKAIMQRHKNLENEPLRVAKGGTIETPNQAAFYSLPLLRLTDNARNQVYSDIAHKVEVRDDCTDFVRFTDHHTVIMDDELLCSCRLFNEWRLPCRHIIEVTRAREKSLSLVNSRWLLTDSESMVDASATGDFETNPMEDELQTSENTVLTEARQLLSNMSGAVVRLGNYNHRQTIDRLSECLDALEYALTSREVYTVVPASETDELSPEPQSLSERIGSLPRTMNELPDQTDEEMSSNSPPDITVLHRVPESQAENPVDRVGAKTTTLTKQEGLMHFDKALDFRRSNLKNERTRTIRNTVTRTKQAMRIKREKYKREDICALCRKPDYSDAEIINWCQCDHCDRWFHDECVGAVNGAFDCPKCHNSCSADINDLLQFNDSVDIYDNKV